MRRSGLQFWLLGTLSVALAALGPSGAAAQALMLYIAVDAPPPVIAPAVIAVDAPPPVIAPVVVAPIAHAVRSPVYAVRAPDTLANRFTLLAGFGGLVMTFDGTHSNAMAIQPTVQRTFNRLELQADLLLADWNPQQQVRSGGHVFRLGAAVRYQAARLRVVPDMTLDAVAELGVGMQRLQPDQGRSRERADFEIGVGFRMLTAINRGNAGSRRILFGMEMMMRLLVAPQPDRPTELGAVFMFGLPVGR